MFEEKAAPQKSMKLIVTGRVQGVGYRAWCKATARKMNLNGWVRNIENGSVEVVMTGGSEQIDVMTQKCHEGPMAAAVLMVKKSPIKSAPPAGLDDFSIRDTIAAPAASPAKKRASV